MAQQRIEAPSTTIQPSPGTSSPDLRAQEALASQQARGAGAMQEAAGQVQQIAATIMRGEAIDQATKDARQVVQYDKDGNLMPPNNDARGWGGLVYNDVYSKASQAAYDTAFGTQSQTRAMQYLSETPTDPAVVSEKMRTYGETALKGVDEATRDRLRPQYESIHNQAVAQARGALEKQNQQVFSEQSKIATEAYAVATANATESGTLAADKPMLDELRERAISLARQSGLGPEAIKAEGARIDAYAGATRDAREIFNRASQLTPGSAEAIAIAKEVDAKANAAGGYKSIVLPILDNAMHRGLQRASMVDAVYQRDVAEKSGNIGRMFLETQQMSQATNWDGSPKYSPAEIEARFTSIFTAAQKEVSGLRPLDQTRILTGAYAQSQQQAQRVMGSEFANAIQMAQYGTQPERASAVSQLQTFVADPRMQQLAAEGGPINSWMANARQVIQRERMNERAGDIVAVQDMLADPKISPATRAAGIVQATKDELIGGASPISVMAAAQTASTANAKYREAIKAENQVGAALNKVNPVGRNVQIGTLDPSEIELLRAKAGPKFGKEVIGGVEVDAKYNRENPAHAAINNDWMARTKTMSAEWNADVASIPDSSDAGSAERKAKAVSDYNSLRQLKLDAYGPQMHQDKVQEFVAGQLKKDVGGNYDRLMAWKTLGPTAEAADVAKFIQTTSPTRNVGSKGDGNTEITSLVRPGLAVQEAANDALNVSTTGSIAQLGAPITRVATSWLPAETRNRFSANAYEKTRPVFAELAALGGIKERVDGEKLFMDPQDAALFEGRMNAYIRENGQRDEVNGLNKYTQAMVSVLGGTERGRDFALEAIRDVDGAVTGHKIAYRPATMMLNKAAGNAPQMNENDQIHFVSAYAWQENPLAMQHMQLETMRFRKKVNVDGAVDYWLTGLTKDGRPMDVLKFDPANPHFEQERVAMGNAIAREMGKGYYADIAWIGGDLARNMVISNKQSSLVALAAAPHDYDTWTAALDAAKEVLPYLATMQLPQARANAMKILDDAHNRESFESIKRNGSPFHFLVGNQGIDFLSGQLGIQTRVGGSQSTPYVPFQRSGATATQEWPPITDPELIQQTPTTGKQARDLLKGTLSPEQLREAEAARESADVLTKRTEDAAARRRARIEETTPEKPPKPPPKPKEPSGAEVLRRKQRDFLNDK